MQVHTFLAESAADAVAQIRAQLGPQAVVLNVRRLPAEGLSRLWQKPRIEVLAYLPEGPQAAPAPAPDALEELRQEMSQIRQKVEARDPRESAWPATDPTAPIASSRDLPRAPEPARVGAPPTDGSWRIGNYLESTGLLPVYAHLVLEELRGRHGNQVPVSMARELELASEVLRSYWNRSRPAQVSSTGAHVLIGPSGVGKTVCICKWLAHSVLVEGRAARVWRLDGRTANTAEALSVYSEILGVPVERSVPAELPPHSDLLLVDFPGVDAHDAAEVAQLGQHLRSLPNPKVHLVLNAAYETPLLLAQIRAFALLPISDLILTHLDEEGRWGKAWNLVLGTNFSLGFLSAGQNIPGVWSQATPEQIFARQFPVK